MKKVEAIIEPIDLEVLKDRLQAIGFDSLTVSQVKRFDRETTRTEVYRGVSFSADFVAKLRIQIFVTDAEARKVVDALQIISRAGKIGDGSIFVEPIEEVIRIQTGERGEDAL